MKLTELARTLKANLQEMSGSVWRFELPTLRHHDLISIPGVTVVTDGMDFSELGLGSGLFAVFEIPLDEGTAKIAGKLNVDPHGTQTYSDCRMLLTWPTDQNFASRD